MSRALPAAGEAAEVVDPEFEFGIPHAQDAAAPPLKWVSYVTEVAQLSARVEKAEHLAQMVNERAQLAATTIKALQFLTAALHVAVWLESGGNGVIIVSRMTALGLAQVAGDSILWEPRGSQVALLYPRISVCLCEAAVARYGQAWIKFIIDGWLTHLVAWLGRDPGGGEGLLEEVFQDMTFAAPASAPARE